MEQSTTPSRRYSAEEYLRLENTSAERSEYRDGEIIAIAGGTYEHALIQSNLLRNLGNRLAGTPCRIFGSDLKIRITGKSRYSYPDASVICGEAMFDPLDPSRTTVTNPKLLIEVLSPSTEAIDRGEKFNRYIQIESLTEYILVSQTEPRVESFYRQSDGGWMFTRATELTGVCDIRSLELRQSLAEIYAGIAFRPDILA